MAESRAIRPAASSERPSIRPTSGPAFNSVPKVGEKVAAQLRRQIITGELREGDALPPESELMEQLGVSRPTLREAFRVLESEGVIQIRRGARGGARVLLPEVRPAARAAGTVLQYRGVTVADVYEAITRMELSMVAGLARKRSAKDLGRLDQMISAGDELVAHPVEFEWKHVPQFHQLLMEIAGNQTTVLLHEMLSLILESHVKMLAQESFNVEQAAAVQSAHAQLVDLIRKRNGDEAVVLWQNHLTEMKAVLTGSSDDETLEVLG